MSILSAAIKGSYTHDHAIMSVWLYIRSAIEQEDREKKTTQEAIVQIYKMIENFNTSESTAAVCSVFDTYPYVIVATVSACSGVVSGLCCIFVISLVFLFKKHYFFIQRMILYQCLAILLRSLSVILRFHRLGYETESTAQDTVCVISGFTSQLTLCSMMTGYSVITFTLLMTAVFHKNMARLERLYVVLIFILPLTFNWIPFIGNSYGRAGLWCWIRNVNYDDDCTKHHLGEIFRYILWHVPLFGLLIVLIPAYLLTIVYVARQRFCKLRKNTIMSHDPEKERLRKHINEEVWPILFFPIGVVFCNLFILIDTFYSLTNSDPSYTIWILHGIFGELQGGYIALIYVLDHSTLKRLTYSNIKAAITRAKRDEVYEYPVEDGGGMVSDSAEHSHSYEAGYRSVVG